MKVKTFRANSIQEAIGLIKNDMGKDAMIVSTRKIDPPRKSPYGPHLFEVTASLPESAPSSPSAGTGRMESIMTEIDQIKDMLQMINVEKGLPNHLLNSPDCLSLYVRLLKSGLSRRRIEYFFNKAEFITNPTDINGQDLNKRLIKSMLACIDVVDPFDCPNEKLHIAAFVGPTGVGKTTTIAKLAAELNIQQKKRIGLISIDTYRIGAIDQLKTYASIMGIPFLPAFSRIDLENAIDVFADKEIILIDTAGQSHLNDTRLHELNQIMDTRRKIHKHLVLSINTNHQDNKEAALRFSGLSPESYIFTKIDETRRHGPILDQVMDMKLPVSYLTNGQSVPEDIVQASRKEILNLIFERPDLKKKEI